MPDTIFVAIPRAEYEALMRHLRETVISGRLHHAGVTLDALDLEGAAATLEAAALRPLARA